MKQYLPTLVSLLFLCIHFTYISAQSPAPAPAPPVLPPPAPPVPTTVLSPGPAVVPTGPANILKILQKAGGYSAFIRILKSTQSVARINRQIKTSDQGLTIFAPDDGAFAKLKPGFLNSFTAQQQDQLIQSHILPSFMSIEQFDTASNPMSTQAGGTDYGEFPLNVTTSGNSVNLTTGFANASIISTVYTDSQLAVYQVDHVLLPQKFFVAPPPSAPPAPAPASPKHKKTQASDSDSSAKAVDSSDAVGLIHEPLLQPFYLVAVLAASFFFG